MHYSPIPEESPKWAESRNREQNTRKKKLHIFDIVAKHGRLLGYSGRLSPLRQNGGCVVTD